MKQNSSAFTLIHNLTMSEKRYFKIFSERHTIGIQNKYVILFDILDHAKEENDDKIKLALKKQDVNPQFLSADRNYLYHLILKSLNDFHDSKTLNLEIKELLLSIEILFQKGMYVECLKLISRSETQALECENYALMIDILTWKKKCAGYSIGLKAANEINQQIEVFLKLLNDLKKITNLYYKSYFIQLNAEGVFNSSHRAQMDKILEHAIIRKEEQIETFTGRVFYSIIKANHALVNGDKKKESLTIEKLIRMIEESKTYGLENPLDFVSIYSRLIAIQKNGDKKYFFESIQKLKAFGELKHIRKELVQQRIFMHCNTHELEYYLMNREIKTAILRMQQMETEIEKSNFKLENYHLIYFNYLKSAIYVSSQQPNKALKVINTTLNNFLLEDRAQVMIRMMILNMVCHYELKNFELIPSIYKKLLLMNKKTPILLKSELKLVEELHHLSQIINPTKKESIEIFQAVIHQIQIDSSIKKSNLLENYKSWIQTKINS